MSDINNPGVAALVAELQNKRWLSLKYAGVEARTVVFSGVDTRCNPSRPIRLKCIKRGWPDNEHKYVRREVLTHRAAIHPNVIRQYEVFLTPSYLCMMCEDGGEETLEDRIMLNSDKAVQERERLALQLFRQMVKPVAFLHAGDVVHRDLNPSNFRIHNDTVRLLGFRAAKATNTSVMRTNIGVNGFKAPEVLTGQPYGAAADLFSLGAVLYSMVMGVLPRGGSDSPGAMVNSPDWNGVDQGLSPGVALLLEGLLEPTPATRTTMDQLLANPCVAEDGQPHVNPAQVANGNLLYLGQSLDEVEGLIQEARGMGEVLV